MLEWGRAIHDAIPDSRLFIAAFAILGLLLFGAVGWLIDRGYQMKNREQAPPASSAPASPVQIRQQSGGPNSPNVAVVGSGNIVNPLPAERTIDDAAAAGIVARIAPFRGQRVRVSAANNEEAQRLGTRIRVIVIAAGWDCPSFVGQAFLPTQLGLPGVRVEASPGTDAAATAVADALSGSTWTGLTLNSTYTSDAPGTIMIIVFPNPRP